jgi:short-subunit dehydrogenase
MTIADGAVLVTGANRGIGQALVAELSLSQSLRALVAGQGVKVHVVLSGPVDTEMSRDIPVPKASPESVARAIFDGVEAGEADIFPDPMSDPIADSWRRSAAKELERQFATFVAPEPVGS